MEDDVRPALQEMVRQAERVIDHQMRVWEQLDTKAEQMMRLSLLILAGAVTLATFFLQDSTVALDRVFLAVFVGAGLFVVVAILFFVASYTGFREDRRFRVGPSPAWLQRRAHYVGRSPMEHRMASLAAYREYFDANRGGIDLALRSRKRGLIFLVAGILLFVGAFVYVVGGAIL